MGENVAFLLTNCHENEGDWMDWTFEREKYTIFG